MLAEVLDIERDTDESTPVVNIKCDPSGGANLTAEHFNPPGEDSLPLPGDIAALTEGAGSGGAAVAGYIDPKNEGKAANGEKRLYARDAGGAVKVELWFKGDGSLVATNGAGTWELKPDGALEVVAPKIVLNGVEIDDAGNLKAPGEVTAMALGPGVKLSTHLHPTGTGPSGPATPGT